MRPLRRTHTEIKVIDWSSIFPKEEFMPRYIVNVTENIATAGFNTTKHMKYRWTVTDTETDQIVKVSYQFSVKLAQSEANRWVEKKEAKNERIETGTPTTGDKVVNKLKSFFCV